MAHGVPCPGPLGKRALARAPPPGQSAPADESSADADGARKSVGMPRLCAGQATGSAPAGARQPAEMTEGTATEAAADRPRMRTMARRPVRHF